MNELISLYRTPDVKVLNRDGIEIAGRHSNLESEVFAIRNGVAMSDMSHLSIFRLCGEHHHQLLNRILPRSLNLRNNRLFQSLFILDDDWHYADVYALKEENSYILLVKGVDMEDAACWILDQLESDEKVELRVLNHTHSAIGINGPFAWELLSELMDPEIISLPYLSFYYPGEDQILIRSGETGEFGYLLVFPVKAARELWDKAIEQGEDYGLELAGVEALDYCALENNFFNVHKEGTSGANPKELQLQWRVTYSKHFNQSEGLKLIKSEPLTRRLVSIWSNAQLIEGDPIFYGEKEIGRILNASQFQSGSGYIGLSMMDLPYSEVGISGQYSTQFGSIHTIAPPFINNHSLMVNPQLHSYQDRDEIEFSELNALRT